MSRKLTLSAIAFAFILNNAAAQGVVVWGGGNESCGRWLEDKSSSPSSRNVLKHWVLGFLSGANWTSTSGQARPPDADAAIAFVDQYCQNNPLHILSFAASALVSETGGQKAKHEWKR